MFKRGDIVRLQSGKAPIKILRVDYPFAFGRYIWSGINVERRMSEMLYHSLHEETYMPNPFRTGQFVKLKNGTKAMIVSEILGQKVRCSYLNSKKRSQHPRPWADYELYAPVMANQGELFDTKEGPASYVGVTRNGMYVLEKLNDDEELVYQQNAPVPYSHYTVELKNVAEGYTFHRAIDEGRVQINDLVMRPNGMLYRVINVNTQNANTQPLEGQIMTGKSL